VPLAGIEVVSEEKVMLSPLPDTEETELILVADAKLLVVPAHNLNPLAATSVAT
jgi:hypothetical protein